MHSELIDIHRTVDLPGLVAVPYVVHELKVVFVVSTQCDCGIESNQKWLQLILCS